MGYQPYGLLRMSREKLNEGAGAADGLSPDEGLHGRGIHQPSENCSICQDWLRQACPETFAFHVK